MILKIGAVAVLIGCLAGVASAGCEATPCDDTKNSSSGTKVVAVTPVEIKSYIKIDEKFNDIAITGDTNGEKCLEDTSLVLRRADKRSSCPEGFACAYSYDSANYYLTIKIKDLRGLAKKLTDIADKVDTAKKELK